MNSLAERQHTASRPEPVVVAFLATVAPSIVLAHGLATVLHHVFTPDLPRHVPGIAFAVAGSATAWALSALVRARYSRDLAWAGPVLAAAAVWLIVGSWLGGVVTALAGAVQVLAGEWLLGKLPQTLAGLYRRRKVASILWTLLAVLAVVQVARLSSYMTDRSVGWFLTTQDEWYVNHMCVASYIYAADLHRQGQSNVYEAVRLGRPSPSIEHLQAHLEDPFLYPPPFLLVPLGAIAFASDFYVIRSLSFAVQFLVFLGAMLCVAHWTGGPRGRMALWALPAVFASVPVLQTFQFGQVHLTVFGLALVGMLCLEAERRLLGGALLAAAIVVKIFPGILILYLLVRKRFKDAAVTSGFIILFVLVAWAILGSAPFEAFVDYQLPLMLQGEVIEVPDPSDPGRAGWLASNLSVAYFVMKLQDLGLRTVPGVAEWLTRLYGLALLATVCLVRRGRENRGEQVIMWLALLNLSVHLGGGAWVEYAPATSVWLLALLGVELHADWRRAVLLGTAWFFCFLPLGMVQIGGSYPADKIALLTSVLFTGMVIGLNAWVFFRAERGSVGFES